MKLNLLQAGKPKVAVQKCLNWLGIGFENFSVKCFLIKNFLKLKKCGTLHEFACHPCAGAMLIFSVSFQF